MSVLGIQELPLLLAVVPQVARQQSVLFLGALRIQLDAVAADSVQCVANDQVVATANLVFETASHFQLDQDRLRHLLLNLEDLLHEVVAFGVEVGIDLEDGLLVLHGVEHNGTVAARDEVFLFADALYQGVHRDLEAVFQNFLLHLELLPGAFLFSLDQVFELDLALVDVFICQAVLLPDKSFLAADRLHVVLSCLRSVLFLRLLLNQEVGFGDGHDLDVVLGHLLCWEDCLGVDVCDVFWVFDVEQVVVFLEQLVVFERAELESAEELIVLSCSCCVVVGRKQLIVIGSLRTALPTSIRLKLTSGCLRKVFKAR